MNRKYDIGWRRGRLLLLKITPETRVWKCDCGTIKEISRSSKAKSCGCLKREVSGARLRSVQPIGKDVAARVNTKHGYCRSKNSPEYVSYLAARARCNNPNDEHYPNWGGRGIEFRFSSFEEFHAEVGDRPVPKFLFSIGRIDNNGHYERGNVRWETDTQQNRNRRKRGQKDS